MKSLSVCALAAFFALTCFTPGASAQQYTITNLGGLPGYTYTSPDSINNLGQVVGGATTSDFSTTHPFRTEPNSPINPATDDLGVPNGATSAGADDINDSGQVVITATGYSNYSAHAFRLDPGNPNLVDLGLRSNTGATIVSANANAINGTGQVTGAATEAATAVCYYAFSSRAFRTTANGTVTSADDLGTLLPSNCRSSTGFGINASGQVVGTADVGNIDIPDSHAFLATPGSTMQDLGTLGGTRSTAYSINNAGQIVGASEYTGAPSQYDTHAFFIDTNSTMVDIGTLGGSSSTALHINNLGQAVGFSSTAGDAAVHAFIYQNGVMTDLNSLIPPGSGWVLEGASGINDLGQIVGNGTYNGNPAAFRLDPSGSAGVTILLSYLSNGSLTLSAGNTNALTATLNAILASIGNNTSSASGELGAFINQVNALVNSGKLDAAQGASLIAEANNILNNL